MMAECLRLQDELREFEQEHNAGIVGLSSEIRKLEKDLKSKTTERVTVEAEFNKVGPPRARVRLFGHARTLSLFLCVHHTPLTW